MSDPPLLEMIGLIAVALLAAAAIVLRDPRGRALVMLGAGVLAPVLLAASIWDSGQLDPILDRPLVAAIGGAVLVVVVIAGAWAIDRWPIALVVAALLALPFRVTVETGSGSANLLVPLYVVIAAGTLAFCVPRLLGWERRGRPTGSIEWMLAAFVVVYAAQGLYSSDFDKALQQICFFFVPFALLFVMFAQLEWTPKLRRVALITVAGLGVLFSAVGIVQYLTGEILFNPRLLASNQLESYFRVNSLFFDPNVFGRFEALVIVLVAAVVLWATTQRLAWTAVGTAAFMWIGMLFSFSQSSFIALLAGLAVLAALRYQARWIIGPLIAAVAIGAVLVLATPGLIGIDTSQSGAFERATSGRFGLIGGGGELFLDRPVAGYGSGAFGREFRLQRKSDNVQAASVSHTIPITVAAEQGVIGLVVYVGLLIAALVSLLGGARGSPARAAVAAAFIALVVHTLLYAAFLEDPAAWVLLAAGTALAAAPRTPEERVAARARRQRARTAVA